MKKSNYISIAFFVFFFGTITTMYIDAKTNGKDDFDKRNKQIISDQKLGEFSIIVAHKNTKIKVISGEQNLLTESYYKRNDSSESSISEFKKKCNYRLINDTLFIDKTYKANVTIKANSLKIIFGKGKNTISFNDYKADSLFLNFENTKLNYSKISVKYLDIKATNSSDLHFGDSNIESLNIDLDKSKISGYNLRSKKTNVVLKNNSNIRISKAKILNMNSDNSSKYHLY